MKNLLSLFLFLSVTFSFAQSTLKARVIDESNFPLPGAIITTEDGQIVVSDFDGYFSVLIENVEENIEAKIAYTGFTPQTLSLTSSDAILVVVLQQEVNVLDEIIEDLYYIENVLEKKDNLIIITEDEPNDSIIARMRYLFDHDGIFVVIHNIRRLQYNILNHNLVPSCVVLNENEVDEFKKNYNVKNSSQLPEISRFDPQALALCIRPGEIAKFTRKSITAMETNYYRVCV